MAEACGKAAGGVWLTDSTFRAANEALWDSQMTTAMLLPICRTLDNVGLHRIDLIGPAQFASCIRRLQEDPWQRIRLVRQQVSKTPLRAWVRSCESFGTPPLIGDA